ncbi:MAG: ABC transporter permease [Alphaproteobacteria bacterium]
MLTSVYLQPASLDLIDGTILDDLATADGVAFAAPLGFGDSYQGRQIVGTTADFVRHLAGGDLAEGAMFAAAGEAVVGADVPLALDTAFVPTHGQIALEDDEDEHEGVAYRVAGRLPPLGTPWDRAILIPIETVWATHGLPTGHAPSEAEIEAMLAAPGAAHADEDEDHEADAHEGEEDHVHADLDHAALAAIGPPWDRAFLPGVPAIVVEPADIGAAYQLRQRYRSDDRTMAVFPAEVLIQLYGVLGDVRDLLAWISILTQVLVIGAVLLAIMATMAQKRRLVGVLRALGASRGYVVAVAWINVSLLIAVGAAIGLGIGWGAALLLSSILEAETAMRLPVALTWQEVGLVAILIGIGLVLAVIPSLRLYRQPVAGALKG